MSNADWTRSSRCQSAACIEVRRNGDTVQVRDSKDPAGPVITYTADEWGAFVVGVEAGDFDLSASTTEV